MANETHVWYLSTIYSIHERVFNKIYGYKFVIQLDHGRVFMN